MYNHTFEGANMENLELEAATPKVYGSVTVGERGQIVIPVEARKELELKPSSKLIVFSGFHRGSLIIAKAELVGEYMARATTQLAQIVEILNDEEQQAEAAD